MSTPLPSLIGLTTAEIAELIEDRKDAKWRAKQIATWIYQKAAATYDEMSDVPKDLKERLKATHQIQPLEVARHAKSTDNVDKLLVHGGDHEVFECVLLPYEDRVSCCISSQVGCPMACSFCATGLGGFDRNLTAGEIVGQYLMLQRASHENNTSHRPSGGEGTGGEGSSNQQSTINNQQSTITNSKSRISHVAFMGMGEPLLNLPNVLKAVRLLHDEVGLSYRHITVSTVGLVPQIYQLAKENLPIHLALSLHSPFDEVRTPLMPVNKKWPVRDVIMAMRSYAKTTGRKITIEYLLIDKLTDTTAQAEELARLIKGVPSVVNLIPFNFVQTDQGYGRPAKERVRGFKQTLKNKGVNVTQRVERGHDIAAACGQLAGQHQGRFAKRGAALALPVLS